MNPWEVPKKEFVKDLMPWETPKAEPIYPESPLTKTLFKPEEKRENSYFTPMAVDKQGLPVDKTKAMLEHKELVEKIKTETSTSLLKKYKDRIEELEGESGFNKFKRDFKEVFGIEDKPEEKIFREPEEDDKILKERPDRIEPTKRPVKIEDRPYSADITTGELTTRPVYKLDGVKIIADKPELTNKEQRKHEWMQGIINASQNETITKEVRSNPDEQVYKWDKAYDESSIEEITVMKEELVKIDTSAFTTQEQVDEYNDKVNLFNKKLEEAEKINLQDILNRNLNEHHPNYANEILRQILEYNETQLKEKSEMMSPGDLAKFPNLIREESGIKDMWDSFYLGASEIKQKSKDYFISALPNYIFSEIPIPKGKGLLGEKTKQDVIKQNEINKTKRAKYREKYKESQKKYNIWLDKHPEMQPRREWEKGVIKTISDNPKVLQDPVYWGYVAAQSSAFTIGVMGTTLGVTALTKNPIIGMAAGVAIATPMQSQDLYEDLIANGATEEQASNLSIPIGAAIATVEVAGDLPLLKSLSKPFNQMLTRNIKREVAKRTIASLTKRGLKTFTAVEIAETIEEILQGAIQDATVKTVNANRSILKNIPETVIQTLIATAPMALIGGGSDIIRHTKPDISIKQGEEEVKISDIIVRGKEEFKPFDLETKTQPEAKPFEEITAEEVVVTLEERFDNTIEILTDKVEQISTLLEENNIVEAGKQLTEIEESVKANPEEFRQLFQTEEGVRLNALYTQLDEQYTEAEKGLSKLERVAMESEKKIADEKVKEEEKIKQEKEVTKPIEEAIDEKPAKIEEPETVVVVEEKVKEEITKIDNIIETNIEQADKLMTELHETYTEEQLATPEHEAVMIKLQEAKDAKEKETEKPTEIKEEKALLEEAKKYKSAEEFEKAFIKNLQETQTEVLRAYDIGGVKAPYKNVEKGNISIETVNIDKIKPEKLEFDTVGKKGKILTIPKIIYEESVDEFEKRFLEGEKDYPPLVVGENYTIIAGNHRLKMLERVGEKNIRIIRITPEGGNLTEIYNRSQEKPAPAVKKPPITPKKPKVAVVPVKPEKPSEKARIEAEKVKEKVVEKKPAKVSTLEQVKSDIDRHIKQIHRGQDVGIGNEQLEQSLIKAYESENITPTAQQYYTQLRKIYGKVLPIKERKAKYNEAFLPEDYIKAVENIKKAFKDERGSFSWDESKDTPIINDIKVVAKYNYKRGKQSLKEFTSAMKESLSDVWDIIKDSIGDIYNYTKDVLAKQEITRLEKREATLRERIAKEKKISPRNRSTHFKYTSIKNKIELMKVGAKIGAKDIAQQTKTTQNAIVQYAKQNMPIDEAGKRDVGKLLTLIRDTTDPVRLEDVFSQIDNITVGINKKINIGKIDAIIKKNKLKKVGGKIQGKLPPDVYPILNKIKEIRRVRTDDKIKVYVDNLKPNDVNSIALFSTYGDLKNKTAKEVENAYNKLNDIITDGKTWYKDEMEKRNKHLTELKAKVEYILTGGEMGRTAQEYRTMNKKVKEGFFRDFINRNQSFEWIMDIISGKIKQERTGEGFLQTYFGDKLNKSTNTETKGKREYVELLNEKAIEIFGIKGNKLAKVLQKNTKVEKKTGVTYEKKSGVRSNEIPLSQNEAYKIWMDYQDKKYASNFEKMGFDETTIEQLEKFIDPKVMKWAEWQLNEFYVDYYIPTNKIYRENYFVDLGNHDNYSPKTIEITDITDSESELLNQSKVLASVLNRSLKATVNHSNPIAFVDGDTVLSRHIAEMEHFKAWVGTVRELRAVFESREIQHILKYEYGNKLRSIISLQINDFARGGIDQANVITLLDKIRRNFVTAELGLNERPFFKQLVSTVAFSMDIGTGNLILGMADYLHHPQKVMRIIKSSELIHNRYKTGWNPEIEAAMKTATTNTLAGTRSHLQKARNLMLLGTKLGDFIAIVGGWGVYKHHYKQQMRKHGSHKKASEFAMNKWERIVARTQQSAALKDLSQIQKTSIGKLATMFHNSQQLYFRYEMAALRNLSKGRGNVRHNLRIVFVTHFLLPVLFQALSNLFTDEDKETETKRLLRAGILGSWNGLLIVGDIVEFFIEKAMGEWWDYSPSPVISSIQNAGLAAAYFAKGIKDVDTEIFMKGMDKLTHATSQTITGFPYRPVKRIIGKGKSEKKKTITFTRATRRTRTTRKRRDR